MTISKTIKISKYLTLYEATYSQTAITKGIDNTPTPQQLENMKYVATEVFDKVREYVAGPLHASSFFRAVKLNKLIGGSAKRSQHMEGEAIDIDCDFYKVSDNLTVFNFILKTLSFDQLILEYPDETGMPAWVHVSLTKGKNRREVLVKLKKKYIDYLDYKIGMI